MPLLSQLFFYVKTTAMHHSIYSKPAMLAMALVCLFFSAFTQPVLYGKTERQALESAPYSEWFYPGYTNYHPDKKLVSQLKSQNIHQLKVEIWLGTWCGDSKREVPRFFKLLDTAGFKPEQIVIYSLGGADSLYKQSPGHEEAGKGIFRVPVFIVYRGEKEIGRINEYPVWSLEKDLLQIISGKPYTPNYKSFALIKEWLQERELEQENISARGLAGMLRPLIAQEYELNSLAYLLMRQGDNKNALKIFQVNAQLYPASPLALAGLAEGFLKNGYYDLAISYSEYALENNTNAPAVKGILKILYAAWEEKGR